MNILAPDVCLFESGTQNVPFVSNIFAPNVSGVRKYLLKVRLLTRVWLRMDFRSVCRACMNLRIAYAI